MATETSQVEHGDDFIDAEDHPAQDYEHTVSLQEFEVRRWSMTSNRNEEPFHKVRWYG